jgi:hypothetical protein
MEYELEKVACDISRAGCIRLLNAFAAWVGSPWLLSLERGTAGTYVSDAVSTSVAMSIGAASPKFRLVSTKGAGDERYVTGTFLWDRLKALFGLRWSIGNKARHELDFSGREVGK